MSHTDTSLIRPRSSSQVDGSRLAQDRRVAEIPVQKHKEYYFDDGNIVVIPLPSEIADKEKRTKSLVHIAFRLHGSLLSKYSSVFHEMFQASPLSELEAKEVERYDGAPVVHMPDSFDDWESLMHVIYGGLVFMKFTRGAETHRAVKRLSGALTLSKKYMMDEVFSSLASIFEEYWPQTLDGWDSYEAFIRSCDMQKSRHTRCNPRLGYIFLDNFLLDPSECIPLARLVGLMRVLPAAFYDLIRLQHYGSEDELDDGIPEGPRGMIEIECDFRTTSWKHLDREDLFTCIRGKGRLQRFIAQSEQRDLLRKDDQCSLSESDDPDTKIRGQACKNAADQLWYAVLDACILNGDPLATLADPSNHSGVHDNGKMCQPCRAVLHRRFKILREKIWWSLPTILGIALSFEDWRPSDR